MSTEKKTVNPNILKMLSTAELIEAFEAAKELKLSDEFQMMLSNAIKLRENDES